MKRIYVVLIFIFSVVFWAGTLLGQRSSSNQSADSYEKRLKMREEIHRRILDKFFKGIGSDEDMFSDMESMMQEIMSESFGGFDSFSQLGKQNFKHEWSVTNSGRVLVITPNSPEQQLDIDVSKGTVTIKGKVEEKTALGMSSSNFVNSFNVPGDCDASRVSMDQKDGKIIMNFPFLSHKNIEAPIKDKRKPVGPSGDEIQI
jgi:HSP20 family molecular chaperone IbpA